VAVAPAAHAGSNNARTQHLPRPPTGPPLPRCLCCARLVVVHRGLARRWSAPSALVSIPSAGLGR